MCIVRLTPVDERLLQRLLSVAVAEAQPDEVMPPVEAPPGWSEPRMDAFCAFYRSHQAGLDGPTRTRMYAVLEARGIGGRALRLLLDEAAPTGARAIVAETTSSNVAAIGVLRRCGATFTVNGPDVHAEIRMFLD